MFFRPFFEYFSQSFFESVYVLDEDRDVTLELQALYFEPGTYEVNGLLSGIGALSEARASNLWLLDHKGVYREFLAEELGWEGGRVDLDPDKLFATFGVNASTPAPLANLNAIFSDGSTHREKYTDGIDIYFSGSTASGVHNKERPENGWLLGVYLGAKDTLTDFYCHSNQFTGSIPELSANTALAYFWCYSNQVTGTIPDLSANAALTDFRCYSNQLTGEIPNLSANAALTNFHCYSNQVTGTIPDLSANAALVYFWCYSNQLTGTIPNLSANTALTDFRCHNNQLTGEIPNLSANAALTDFHCYSNQLTGTIPDLSANAALTNFRCSSNQLTGFAGGWPSKAFRFEASINALTELAVNQILIDADTDGIAAGTIIALTGGTNAAPTGAGITAKNNLIANGAIVTTN